LATVLNRLNYQLTRILDAGLRSISITSVALISPSQVLVSVNSGRSLTSGRFLVVAGSGGIADKAGNALDGEFRGTLPSGNGAPGGNFRARLNYSGHKVVGPLALAAAAQIQATSAELPAGPLNLRARARRGR